MEQSDTSSSSSRVVSSDVIVISSDDEYEWFDLDDWPIEALEFHKDLLEIELDILSDDSSSVEITRRNSCENVVDVEMDRKTQENIPSNIMENTSSLSDYSLDLNCESNAPNSAEVPVELELQSPTPVQAILAKEETAFVSRPNENQFEEPLLSDNLSKECVEIIEHDAIPKTDSLCNTISTLNDFAMKRNYYEIFRNTENKTETSNSLTECQEKRRKMRERHDSQEAGPSFVQSGKIPSVATTSKDLLLSLLNVSFDDVSSIYDKSLTLQSESNTDDQQPLHMGKQSFRKSTEISKVCHATI